MSGFYIIAVDHICLHWSIFIITSVIDFYIYVVNGWDKFKNENRVFPNVNFSDVVNTILTNQFFVLLPMVYLSVDLFPKGSLTDVSNFYKIPVTMLVTEFLFYYIHVLFHSGSFWKYHVTHHEWTGPSSISTFHCHPLEMALLNVFPVLGGAVIAGLNFDTMRVWHMIAVANTMVFAHGGYRCFGRSEHDLHHEYKTCNYGLFGFLDKIHGTYLRSG
jgi:sterol desaturase/sphingolipid hydroxylase (fatty acid hydroxylase superfamily)